MFRIQTAGLGGMKPNTIILGWPNSWRKKEEDSWRVFVDSIRYASAAHMALLVPKGIQESDNLWLIYHQAFSVEFWLRVWHFLFMSSQSSRSFPICSESRQPRQHQNINRKYHAISQQMLTLNKLTSKFEFPSKNYLKLP